MQLKRIDHKNGVPIYLQLEEQIRLAIHAGELEKGDPMPTVRELAVELGVNANTIARVYRDLQNQGVLVLKRGVGTFVADSKICDSTKASQMKRLEKLAKSISSEAKKAKMTPMEVLQLIERHW